MYELNQSLRTILQKYALIFLAGVVSVFVGILYLSVASSVLTDANFGNDGGDFLAAILTHGIPHPTGYPTYVMLGILFQQLPINTHVYRGVLASIVPAAMGAGLMTAWVGYICCRKTPIRLISAATAGIAWGVAPLIFSQAVIVEVHGLQSFFVMVTLWWMTLNLKENSNIAFKWTLLLALLVGLGLGNHITILLFLPAVLLVLLLSLWRMQSWKHLLAQACLMLVGLSVYLYLPLQAKSYPPINWGNPQTWTGFLWEVTGSPYHGLVFRTEAAALRERISSVAYILLDQYGALGLIAGIIGATQHSFSIKWIRWILIWIFVVYFVFAIGYNTQDSVAYLLPAMIVYAIWIGLAVPSLYSIGWRRIPFGMISVGILIASVGLRISGTRSSVDPRMQVQPARYAETLLQEAPLNAIIETRTDEDTFPLWYYHFGLEQRPDLRIIVISLTQFVWYQDTLVHTYPDLQYPAVFTEDLPNTDWGKQIKVLNPERPVCVTYPAEETITGVGYRCTAP